MIIKNPWVGYLERSYLTIKNALLTRLGNTNPEITDHSESNILVIILSMFAGVAEQLNYYIDNMAREAFISTARRYSSVVKHTRLIDYRIKARVASSADLRVSLDGSDINAEQRNSTDLATNFLIPAGTIFTTNNGIPFISLADYTAETNLFSLPLEQKTFVGGAALGTTNGVAGQVMSLGADYVHNSIDLTIAAEPWTRKETLGRSGPLDKHFIVEISIDQVAYITFGDGINGAIPVAAQAVTGDYYTSLGAAGNVDANTIINTNFTWPTATPNLVVFANLLSSVAGTDYESIERIRRSAPLSLRTLDRAVTRQDYIDITMLAPGVDFAGLQFDCGKFIDIFISPNGGGIATAALLANVKAYIDERRMVTTLVAVQAAGESELYVDVEVVAKFRRDGITTTNDIREALIAAYEYETSTVNRGIRKSDIIGLVDNLEKVDYLELKKLYTVPYMRPVNHVNQFIKSMAINIGSTTKVTWRLSLIGTDQYQLYKEGSTVAVLANNTIYTDPDNIFTITISDNAYDLGNDWTFTTLAYNENQEVDDYSVPVLKPENIVVLVHEQNILN